jgi:hypothetical protein
MEKVNINVDKYEKVASIKLTFKGITKSYDTYRIPLSELYFNDLNGRIATFISQYKSESNDGKSFEKLSRLEYNQLISKFVIDANSLYKNRKTKEDIARNGQKIPGVILDDGRVLDGNRRFALLRELHDETGESKYAYFEAAIFPVPKTDDDKKAIKSLELEIQMGSDEKVDYEPIDLLVDVYIELVKNKTYTIKEFVNVTNKKESEVKLLMDKAEIMADFLEYWGVSEQFFIAKDLKLDGPFQEMVRVRRNLEIDEWHKDKLVFYTYIIANVRGDVTRKIRRIVQLHSRDYNSFMELQKGLESIAQKTFKKINQEKERQSNQPTTHIRIKPNHDDHVKVIELYDKHIDRANGIEAINKPIKLASDALKSLKEIDLDLIERFDSTQRKEFNKSIQSMKEILRELEKNGSIR